MPVLLVSPQNGEASVITLSDKKIQIGRTWGNDIVLADHFSSSRHAVIFPSGKGYAVRDLGSKNGTFLNGNQIHEEVLLNRGDEILIGSTRITFEHEFEHRVSMVEDADFFSISSTVIQVDDILKDFPLAGPEKTQVEAPGFQRVQRDQNLSAVLTEVSQALIFNMELSKLLDYIMDLVTQAIPMGRGILMLKEHEELVPKVVRVHGTSLRAQNIVVSRSILRTALEKNSAILISDVQSDKKLSDQESIVAGQVRSAMCVPLWNNREIVGLIYSDRDALFGKFSQEDLKLLTVLANLAALKIENTRLFEESLEKDRMEQELMMAQRIQRNFMPQGETIFEPYDIAGNTWPCRHIGGDYFDFISWDPSSLAIVIADVSGHGVGAAFLMASLRASLCALIPTVKDLGLLAAKLNGLVCEDSDEYTFISFFLGVLNRDKLEMSYVNAGHNPPMFINPAGNIRTLDNTGYCLGMFPSAGYETKTIEFGPDELLCLYTDGIVEGRSAENEEFGEERLCQQLRKFFDLSPQDILEKINESVRSFSAGDELRDDMTLVIVKRKAAGLPNASRGAL
ncbi:MAG: SpoIIE family protein phosphatase [Acidobacteria bacterium]|nr:SpoIIE family protein phosphatase [Acidobacteriota bacterium]